MSPQMTVASTVCVCVCVFREMFFYHIVDIMMINEESLDWKR